SRFAAPILACSSVILTFELLSSFVIRALSLFSAAARALPGPTNLASADARHYTRNMCGIVGYVGRAEAAPILLDGLRRLEYRGYDSAGIAVVNRGHLETRKCAGRIAALTRLMTDQPAPGSLGVSHTRWATHGKVTDENAHPHFDASGRLALVHNGVIENYQAIKEQLIQDGDTNFR